MASSSAIFVFYHGHSLCGAKYTSTPEKYLLRDLQLKSLRQSSRLKFHIPHRIRDEAHPPHRSNNWLPSTGHAFLRCCGPRFSLLVPPSRGGPGNSQKPSRPYSRNCIELRTVVLTRPPLLQVVMFRHISALETPRPSTTILSTLRYPQRSPHVENFRLAEKLFPPALIYCCCKVVHIE